MPQKILYLPHQYDNRYPRKTTNYKDRSFCRRWLKFLNCHTNLPCDLRFAVCRPLNENHLTLGSVIAKHDLIFPSKRGCSHFSCEQRRQKPFISSSLIVVHSFQTSTVRIWSSSSHSLFIHDKMLRTMLVGSCTESEYFQVNAKPFKQHQWRKRKHDLEGREQSCHMSHAYIHWLSSNPYSDGFHFASKIFLIVTHH